MKMLQRYNDDSRFANVPPHKCIIWTNHCLAAHYARMLLTCGSECRGFEPHLSPSFLLSLRKHNPLINQAISKTDADKTLSRLRYLGTQKCRRKATFKPKCFANVLLVFGKPTLRCLH